ncbi:hypothetical protein Mapa_004996 [Marchantia paleacea]|nr:hypothetical protein Mapa_004996 [Marchantia paleacea]
MSVEDLGDDLGSIMLLDLSKTLAFPRLDSECDGILVGGVDRVTLGTGSKPGRVGGVILAGDTEGSSGWVELDLSCASVLSGGLTVELILLLPEELSGPFSLSLVPSELGFVLMEVGDDETLGLEPETGRVGKICAPVMLGDMKDVLCPALLVDLSWILILPSTGTGIMVFFVVSVDSEPVFSNFKDGLETGKGGGDEDVSSGWLGLVLDGVVLVEEYEEEPEPEPEPNLSVYLCERTLSRVEEGCRDWLPDLSGTPALPLIDSGMVIFFVGGVDNEPLGSRSDVEGGRSKAGRESSRWLDSTFDGPSTDSGNSEDGTGPDLVVDFSGGLV